MKLSGILFVIFLFLLTSCVNRNNFVVRDADDIRVEIEIKYSKNTTDSVRGTIDVKNKTNSDICHCWNNYKLKINGDIISPYPYPGIKSDLLFCLTVRGKSRLTVDVEYHLPGKVIVTDSYIEIVGKSYQPTIDHCDYSK